MGIVQDFAEKLAKITKKNPKGKPIDPETGEFYGSPVSIAPPIGYKKERSIFDQVRDMVKSDQLRAAAIASGKETFEEADDFDVGEDYDPRSPWELNFDSESADWKAFVDEVNAKPESPPSPKPPESGEGGVGEPGAPKQPPGDKTPPAGG